jgi:hypothetical protein
MAAPGRVPVTSFVERYRYGRYRARPDFHLGHGYCFQSILGKEERAGSCLEPALFNFPGLGGLVGEEVDLLRAEIHWRSQDWKAASQVFARLAGALPGPDETLEPKQSRFVMNRAVALALAGESNRLSALETTHGAVMAGTPFGADFRVLTSVQSAPRDFAEVLKRVARVDDFQTFMDSYRARLAGTPDTAPATTGS